MRTRHHIRAVLLAGAGMIALPAVAFLQTLPANPREARMQDSARMLARALEVAEGIKDLEEQTGIQTAVMEAKAAAGDFAGAQRLLDTIPDEIQQGEITLHLKGGAIITFARAQWGAGDFSAALRSASMLAKWEGSGSQRLELVHDIALAQIGKGRFAEALATIETIPTPTAEALNKLEVQSTIPGWGFLHADRTAFLIVDGLGRLAGAYAKAGDLKTAGDLVRKAELICEVPKDRKLQNVLRADMLAGRARGGDIAGALQEAAALRDGSARSSALAAIAAIQAENGDVPGAKKTAEGIKENRSLGETLLAIGSAQIKANDRAGATETLRQAVKHLAAFRSMDDDFHFLMAVVAEQFLAGDLEGAIQSSKMLNPSVPMVAMNLRSMAGISAIGELLERADVTAAEKLYAEITTRMGGPNSDILADLALANARAGNVDAAKKQIADVRSQLTAVANKEAITMVLPTLAEALAETGDFAGALATLKEIDSAPASMGEFLRTQAYAAVARVQGRRGDMAGALKWIEPLEPAALKARTLIGLAEGLSGRVES